MTSITVSYGPVDSLASGLQPGTLKHANGSILPCKPIGPEVTRINGEIDLWQFGSETKTADLCRYQGA